MSRFAFFLLTPNEPTIPNRQMTSNRAGRKLPDKAIDLMDEACANVRVDLDSRPQALDDAERKVLQLEVEEAALAKEEATDSASKARLASVRAELELLRERRTELEGEYRRAQGLLEELAALKREMEEVEWAIGENERKFRWVWHD